MKELLYDLTDQNQNFVNNETQTTETKITEFIEATNSSTTNRRDINKLIDQMPQIFRVTKNFSLTTEKHIHIIPTETRTQTT